MSAHQHNYTPSTRPGWVGHHCTVCGMFIPTHLLAYALSHGATLAQEAK